MDVEFSLTIDDYVNLNLVHAKNSPTVRKQQMIGRLFGTLLVVLAIFLLIPIITNNFFGVTFRYAWK